MSSADDADAQLAHAIDLARAAFALKTRQLVQERDRALAGEAEHASQLDLLAKRLADAEHSLRQCQQDNDALLRKQHLVLSKYSKLKALATQLETFKRSIIHMVTHSPAAPLIIPNDDQSLMLDTDLSEDDKHFQQTLASAEENFNVRDSRASLDVAHDAHSRVDSVKERNNSIGNLEGSKANSEVDNFHRSKQTDLHPRVSVSPDLPIRTRDNSLHNNKVNTLQDNNLYQGPSRSPPRSTSVSPDSHRISPPVTSTSPIDAQTVYTRIRDTLSPQAFREFATTIGAFNASKLSAEEAIQQVTDLVKEPHLVLQMKRLIYKALVDSATTSTVKQVDRR